MDGQIIKAVEMTRQIREQHYRRLSGKSHRERIAFYRKQAREMETIVPALLQEGQAVSDEIKTETMPEDR